MARRLCNSAELIWWCAMILFITGSASQVQIATGPSPDFTAHSHFRPRVFNARNKQLINDTRINKFNHSDVLTIDLEIDGVQHTLDLKLNTDLIPIGYKERTQYEGYYTTEIPQLVELCHYQGSLRDTPTSFAAVSTCRGLRGVIYDTRNLHYVHPTRNTLDAIHYLYKHSELMPNKTWTPNPPFLPHPLRNKRAIPPGAPTKPIRGPYNSNSGSRYLELAFVVDRKVYLRQNSNINEVYRHVKDIANIINALYTPLNVFVALVGIEVWAQGDQIAISPVSARTLKNFMEYRKQYLLREIPNDNAQLLTSVRFDDGIVGKAGVGSICTFESSGGVNTDHSKISGLVAATIAHEIGHNLGMSHDANYCRCPEEDCIMSAALTSRAPIHWSSCSLEQLSLSFSRGMDYCLRNKPERLVGGAECGNGFVEPGEDCDCGLTNICDNKCCDPMTCRLSLNATCATGECCDLTTCRVKKPGILCRASDHECDLPEYCTGNSEYCPEDVHKIDGHSCSKTEAFCYRGLCKTRDDQCKLLWGPSGSSSALPCYDLNTAGNVTGNCRYNPEDSTYEPCRKQNILCGRLQCNHFGGEMRFQFGADASVWGSHTYVYGPNYSVLSCKTAIVDLGTRDVDPGLVPNGAKCAEGSMCLDQRCLSVEYVMKRIDRDQACLNDCNGNGVCNSLGRCHCDEGFQPPDCVLRGAGGSEDSGPADNVHGETNGATIALCIIFLVILPIIVLILVYIWYRRNRPSSMGNKIFVSTYASSVQCFERARNFFTSQTTPASYDESPKVFTISSRLPANGFTITSRDFVGSTNPEVIRSSRNLRMSHSASADESNVRLTPANVVSSGGKGLRSVAKVEETSVSPSAIRHSDGIPAHTSGEISAEASNDSECVCESNSEIYVGFKQLTSMSSGKPTSTPDHRNYKANRRSFYWKKPPPPPTS